MSTKATEEYKKELKPEGYNEKLWDVIKKYPFFPYIQFNYMERDLKGGVLKNGESNFHQHAVNNEQKHKMDKKVIWRFLMIYQAL